MVMLAFSLLISQQGKCQTVENVSARVGEGNMVTIQYDLKGEPEDERFRVKVYSSHDNYSAPLVQVSGDVSDTYTIRPGNGKQIFWEAQELGAFNGELEFEIRAEVRRMLRVTSPAAGKAVRRGSTATIRWTGEPGAEKVKIDLLKNGALVNTPGTVNNSGHYSWSVPKGLSKGKDYSLRFTTGAGTTTSEPFAIRARYPLLLKSALVALPVAVAIIVLGGDGKDELLPRPPEPD